MHLNHVGYYIPWDGYGRFNSRLVAALQRTGAAIVPLTMDNIHAPKWLHDQWGIDWNNLTISCIPARQVQRVPGRHWLYCMIEGSVLAAATVKRIHASGVERVLVPCQHNADVFARSGVNVPIHVLHGGTDPDEFPLAARPEGSRWLRAASQNSGQQPTASSQQPPYTFLALADRGPRKGWQETFDAFYQAFGGKTTGNQDVRLIIKALPGSNEVVEILSKGVGMDRRVIWQNKEAQGDDMASVYAQADCVVLPSYSEGWGMPHREASMMGIPVITQAYSGMDDGHTHEWALVVEGGHMEAIGPGPVFDDDGVEDETVTLGEWLVPNVDNLAAAMRECYEKPDSAASLGSGSAAWLRKHQTWSHAASRLIELIREVDDGLHVDQNSQRSVSANGSSLHASHLSVG
jgi:glycosyltransferase involved in cell wall biosynthesis